MVTINLTDSDLNELVNNIVESNVIKAFKGLSGKDLYNMFVLSTNACISITSYDGHTCVRCITIGTGTNREYSIDIEFRKEGKGEEDIPYLMNKGWVGTTTRN